GGMRIGEGRMGQPGVGEEWDVAEDGLTYTCCLREDAEWSNGDRVVAEDFVDAWKYMLDPETASPAAFIAYVIEGAEAYNSDEGSKDDVAITDIVEKTLEGVLTALTVYYFVLYY